MCKYRIHAKPTGGLTKLSCKPGKDNLVCTSLLCATTNGSTPEPIDYIWGRPLRADVMPFQEDRGAEDVPNLLSSRNRGSYTMDGTADSFSICFAWSSQEREDQASMRIPAGQGYRVFVVSGSWSQPAVRKWSPFRGAQLARFCHKKRCYLAPICGQYAPCPMIQTTSTPGSRRSRPRCSDWMVNHSG